MLHLHVLGGRRVMELCHKGLRYQDHADKRWCGVDLFAGTSNQRRAPPVYSITSSKSVDLLYRNNIQPGGATIGTVRQPQPIFSVFKECSLPAQLLNLSSRSVSRHLNPVTQVAVKSSKRSGNNG
jgi:hypothetical protein